VFVFARSLYLISPTRLRNINSMVGQGGRNSLFGKTINVQKTLFRQQTTKVPLTESINNTNATQKDKLKESLDSNQKHNMYMTEQTEEAAAQNSSFFESLIGKKLEGFRSSACLFAYQNISEHCERKEIYEFCGFANDITSWFSISLLHVWMYLVRLRQDDIKDKGYSQEIIDYFWKDVENKVIAVGLSNPIILGQQLKRYGKMYYGIMIGYDEGLVEGDAQLADAVWRNLFQMEDGISASQLNTIVHYIRKELYNLEHMDLEILLRGGVLFGSLPKQ